MDFRLRRRKEREGRHMIMGAKAPSVKVWDTFGYLRGQRPKPVLELEMDSSRELGEAMVSEKVALIVHCASPSLGEYINPLSSTEISSGEGA
ncbi:MAG: hypothetical protein KAU10_02035 [Dehalococcoidia bacterium]|nr:hypothetical protein [Dehalococcoidia bacterium]